MPVGVRDSLTDTKLDMTIEKSWPTNYFSLIINLFRITGLYPIDPAYSWLAHKLYQLYFWFMFIFVSILNTLTKIIALTQYTNMEDFTDNFSWLVNHFFSIIKSVLIVTKANEISRLIGCIENGVFLHEECKMFSPSDTVRTAIKTTERMAYLFLSFATAIIANNAIGAAISPTQEIHESNGTTYIDNGNHRKPPYYAWYPWSTQISPNYELVCIYQLIAVMYASIIVVATDTLVAGFMIHIRVQLQILTHNIRFMGTRTMKSEELTTELSAKSHRYKLNEDNEKNFKKYVLHHQAIIKLSSDLESLFTKQLLLQFGISLVTLCTVLFQISTVSISSPRFWSFFFYLVCILFQLFLYCWYGNELMLESSSVVTAVYDSDWFEHPRSLSQGLRIIMQRSQNEIIMTAGGFTPLTLETFMSILNASYSCYALLKKVNLE